MTLTQPNINLEFNNPEEVSDKEFGNILGLDFSSIDEPIKKDTKDIKDTKDNLNKDEGKEDADEKSGFQMPEITSKNKDNKDNKEESVSGDTFVSLINTLADKVGFDEPYEGFDPEAEPDQETLVKFIEHNTNKKINESLVEFFDNLTDTTKRIVSFDLNSKGENVESYLRSLIEENTIKNLSLDNEYDQEKIVRQWYANSGDFTKDELEEKIADLKDASQLEKEAKRLKPKLDQIAEKIAKEQEDAQKQLREIEKQMSEDYTERVIDTLKSGNIGGIKLNKEELSMIYSYLTDDKMEVTVHGGKKAQMSPLEAVIFYNKYDKKNGSVENLALATLLLINPKKFEEVYLKKATTQVTNDFVQSTKWSNSLKIGGEPTNQNQSKEKNKKEQNHYSWNLNIK